MASLTEIIHITPDLHTGHITEASLDLLYTTSQVNRRAIDGVKETFSDLSSPRPLPPDIKDRWNKREAWVGRFLHTTRVIQDPWRVDLKLSEFLKRNTFQEPIDIMLFFLRVQQRLDHLMEANTVDRLEILKLGAYAYVESRILRRALTEGVFLTQELEV